MPRSQISTIAARGGRGRPVLCEPVGPSGQKRYKPYKRFRTDVTCTKLWGAAYLPISSSDTPFLFPVHTAHTIYCRVQLEKKHDGHLTKSPVTSLPNVTLCAFHWQTPQPKHAKARARLNAGLKRAPSSSLRSESESIRKKHASRLLNIGVSSPLHRCMT